MADNKLTPEQVDLSFADLEALLKPRLVVIDPETSKAVEDAGELEHAWHFLQVYCGWGLRLPSDDADFHALLKTKELAAYKFYPNLKGGSSLLKDQCRQFTTEVLPKMVQVGNDLSSFANAVKNDDGEMFKIIIELIEGDSPDFAAAIDLIKSLQGNAKTALDNAAKVQTGLAGFKSGLVEGSAKIALAKTDIEADDKVNRAAMDRLTSDDPELQGSLAHYEKLRKKAKADYNYDVKVAATTPTYAWVSVFGLIAASVVAGVYGKRAVDDLKKIDRIDEDIKNAKAELGRAVAANNTYGVANTAVTKITQYTDAALSATTKVQNGWNAIQKGLGDVSTELARTMTTDDEGEKLRSVTLVKKFLSRTEEKWRGIAPALDLLTKHPYIDIEPKPKSLSGIADDIASALKEAA